MVTVDRAQDQMEQVTTLPTDSFSNQTSRNGLSSPAKRFASSCSLRKASLPGPTFISRERKAPSPEECVHPTHLDVDQAGAAEQPGD